MHSPTMDAFDGMGSWADNHVLHEAHPQNHASPEEQNNEWHSLMSSADPFNTTTDSFLASLEFQSTFDTVNGAAVTTEEPQTSPSCTDLTATTTSPSTGSFPGTPLEPLPPWSARLIPASQYPPLCTFPGDDWSAAINVGPLQSHQYGHDGLSTILHNPLNIGHYDSEASFGTPIHHLIRDQDSLSLQLNYDPNSFAVQTTHDNSSQISTPTPLSVDQNPGAEGEEDDEQLDLADAADPCYAKLLYKCLQDAPGHSMLLQDIYKWVDQNSNKAKDAKGWKNSIRHNLSMNHAFEHFPKAMWRLTPEALARGYVISTTKYRGDKSKGKSGRGGQRHRVAKRQAGARVGHQTRSATLRNRGLQHIRSTHRMQTRSHPGHQEYLRHDRLQSPFPTLPQTASPYWLTPSPSPAPPGFGIEREGMVPALPPYIITHSHMPASYGVDVRPALPGFEMQHQDNVATPYYFNSNPPVFHTERGFTEGDGGAGMFVDDSNGDMNVYF